MSTGDISYSDYWAEIAAIVEQTKAEAKEYDSDAYDTLHTMIDGHNWVIYTAYAFDVLKHTEHESYAVEELGYTLTSGPIDWAPLVFGAMMGDCLEHNDWNPG